MKTIEKQGVSIAVIDKGRQIETAQDMLDLLADAYYLHGCSGMIVFSQSLHADFFDLKTGLAGEILQKFSNYQFKLAIVGDFTNIKSKSLRDFIYECNHGSLIYFLDSEDSAMQALLLQ